MSCLCHKIYTKQYDTITPDEAAVLRQFWVEAPGLVELKRPHRKKRNLQSNLEALVATYPKDTVVRRTLNNDDSTFQIVILQGGEKVEPRHSLARAVNYALAERDLAIDVFKSIYEDVLCTENIEKQKLYEARRVGQLWYGIIEDFSAVGNRHEGLLLSHKQFEGLLCLLQFPSLWERASREERVAALKILVTRTAIVNNALLARSFVEEKVRGVRSNVTYRHEAAVRRRNVTCRTMHTQPSRPHPCIVNSVQAIRSAGHSVGMGCDDSILVVILLSFLSTSHSVPVDLLVRGASQRKRWTPEGEYEDNNATDMGLAPELLELLSDTPRLRNVLNNAPSILKSDSSDYYAINQSTMRSVHDLLPHDCLDFWKCQALIATYRAIPWKYIEPMMHDPRTSLVHLEHTLGALVDRFELLSAHTRLDVTLTLVEAIRFRKKSWKTFAIQQATSCVNGVGDGAARVGLIYSEALVQRLIHRTVVDITTQTMQVHQDLQLQGIALDNRTRASFDQATIQLALNDMQQERLAEAEQRLLKLPPLGEALSSMEIVVAVRRAMLLGRIYRWQGKFSTSIDQLRMALTTKQERVNLHFEEDLPELCCDLADSLRDNGQSNDAEQLLLDEIKRHDPSNIPSSVLLSLAEALFAQRRFKEAELRCSDVSKCRWVSSLDKLRLSIIQAKVCHMIYSKKDAQSHWLQALKAVDKFQRTNGHTTRIIILSMSKTLCPIEDSDYLNKSKQQLQALQTIEEPGSVSYWIAGMKEWENFIESKIHSRF